MDQVEKPTVLIIDDSIEVVDLLHRKFQKDHTLFFALDGAEGLSMAKALRPDLVLLDVNLPGADGFEVLKGIRSEDSTRETAVLMLTAFSEPDNIVNAFSLGADDYIVKPFNLLELTARVGAHLKIKRLQRQLMYVERLNTLREVAVSFNHEINNPLMSISTFASFLKREVSDQTEERRRSVDGILEEVKRISRIVRKLSNATNAASVEYGPGVNMIDFEHLDEQQ